MKLGELPEQELKALIKTCICRDAVRRVQQNDGITILKFQNNQANKNQPNSQKHFSSNFVQL